MSLVLGYANENNAIIMSDGRAGGKVSPSEEYDKTRKINDNIIIGFVGYKETSEHFIDCVYMDIGYSINNCYMEEFIEEVEYGMGLESTKEKLESSFLIIGRTRNGKMKFVIAGKDTNYSIKYIPINRIAFIGGVIPIKDIQKICKKNCDIKSSPFEILKSTIEDVSDLDSSVNKNIFYKII